MTSLPMRRGARAVVVDPDRQVLLVHFDFIDANRPHGLWACPGGGVEAGESLEEAVRRELREETGLVIADPGTAVWWKEHHVAMSRWSGQHDTYFLVEVPHFEPAPTMGFEQLRAEHVDAVRWWTHDEVLAAQAAWDAGDRSDPAYATFSPRRLGHHLADLLEHGRPALPLEVSAP